MKDPNEKVTCPRCGSTSLLAELFEDAEASFLDFLFFPPTCSYCGKTLQLAEVGEMGGSVVFTR